MRTYEVDVLLTNGERFFSRKRAREILGIKTRDTLNKHLKALGLFGKARLSTAELVEVLKLQLFLSARIGVNSRSAYIRKRRLPRVLEAEFRVCGIDINQEVRARFGV